MNSDGTSKPQPAQKQTWAEAVILGAEIHYSLQESLNIYPSREQWEDEFVKRQNHQIPIASFVMDELWTNSDTAGREFNRLGGKKRMPDVVTDILRLRSSKGYKAQKAFDDYNNQILASQPKLLSPDNTPKTLTQDIAQKQTKKESPEKRLIKWAGIVFVASCLFPPWQYTADHNGNGGFHARKSAGYSLIVCPPAPEHSGVAFGVQLDFGRLFLEWAALAAVTGMGWLLFVKPAKPRDDKAKRTPTCKPE